MRCRPSETVEVGVVVLVFAVLLTARRPSAVAVRSSVVGAAKRPAVGVSLRVSAGLGLNANVARASGEVGATAERALAPVVAVAARFRSAVGGRVASGEGETVVGVRVGRGACAITAGTV